MELERDRKEVFGKEKGRQVQSCDDPLQISANVKRKKC